MPIPITDLEVTDEGVSATLSFARISHRTYVPWNAVYAVSCTNGCGVLYREDLPEDVAVATPTDAGLVELPLQGKARKSPSYGYRDEGPALRSVPSTEDLAASELSIHLHSRRRRPTLRVVK